MLAKLGIRLPTGGSTGDMLYHVGQAGKWGYVDKHGTTVIPLQFDVPIRGLHMRFPVKSGPPYPVFQAEKWVLVDKRGERLSQIAFDWIQSGEGPIVCGSKLEKWGCVDAQGAEVIPFTFDFARPVKDNLVALQTKGLWGLADQKGAFVIQPTFRDIRAFSDGLALVEFSDQKWGLINREGKEVSKKRFDAAASPAEGLWPVKTGDTWAIADLSGEIIQPLSGLKDVREFHEGLALAQPNSGDLSRYGYIDRSGKFVIPPQFGGGGGFQDGIAQVQTNEHSGLIGRDGRYVVPPVFGGVSRLFDGVALAWKGEELWLIDRTGRVIWPKEKRSLQPPTRDFAKISASKWQTQFTSGDGANSVVTVITYEFLQDKMLYSHGTEKASEWPSQATEQGVLQVTYPDGSLANWELMSYGDDLVMFHAENKGEPTAPTYLTRAGPAGGERKESTAGSKPQAKSDGILSRLPFLGSGGVPSESNARSVFESQNSEGLKTGVLVINSFSKTNGQKTELMGTEAYNVEFKANVAYPNGVISECAVEKWPSNIYSQCFDARVRGVVPKKVGEKEVITGEILFEKTEKGWKGEDGKIY